MNISALLQCVEPNLTTTTTKQLSRIMRATLVMTGRVMIPWIARWAGRGGSYRSVQRFCASAIPWTTRFWVFLRGHLWRSGDSNVFAGDEVVAKNAANLALFMVNFSRCLLRRFRRTDDAGTSLLDLKRSAATSTVWMKL